MRTPEEFFEISSHMTDENIWLDRLAKKDSLTVIWAFIFVLEITVGEWRMGVDFHFGNAWGVLPVSQDPADEDFGDWRGDWDWDQSDAPELATRAGACVKTYTLYWVRSAISYIF